MVVTILRAMQEEINKFDQTIDLINNTHANVFLTGRAGTGKTTFLNRLREECLKAYAVVAPTGIAAINAHGVTMHSFFQLPLHPYLPTGGLNQRISRDKADILRKLELLIIDEVSMVRADMLDAVDYRLRSVRKSQEPFGGVQLLLIGDLFQLPPVVKDEELRELSNYYKPLFFFGSHAIQRCGFVTIELNKVFRQADNDFIDILNKVREGSITSSLLEKLNTRYIPDFKPAPGDHYIRLVTHNVQADRINRERMDLIDEAPSTYTAKITGVFPESSYPVATNLVLKRGAWVMLCKNKVGEYVNGTMAIVTSLGDDVIKVRTLDDNREIGVERQEWDNIEYRSKAAAADDSDGHTTTDAKPLMEEVKIGSFSQFPLRLAWAITIHKSQGLTFDRAIIDVHLSFMAGQTYVALSRCRSLDGLILSEKIGYNAIESDKEVKDFYEQELTKFPDEKKLEDMHREAYIKYVRRLFDTTTIERNLTTLVDLVKSDIGEENKSQALILTSACDNFILVKEATASMQSSQIETSINSTALYSKAPEIQEKIVASSRIYYRLVWNLAVIISNLAFSIDSQKRRDAFEEEKRGVLAAAKRQLKLLEHVMHEGFCLQDVQKFIHKIESEETPPKTTANAVQYDKSVYDALVKWRLHKSKESGLSAFIILHNNSVKELATLLPKTKQELVTIKGIGPDRLKLYGDEILSIINGDCPKESSSEEPDQLPAEASDNKKPKIESHLVSLSMIKEGKSVSQIAEERGMVTTTIMGHLAKCVKQGLYPLERISSMERIQTIHKYMAEHPDATNKEIKEGVPDTIEYFEIDLARWYKQQSNSL